MNSSAGAPARAAAFSWASGATKTGANEWVELREARFQIARLVCFVYFVCAPEIRRFQRCAGTACPSIARHPHPSFHEAAGGTAHHDLGDGPLTALLAGLGADSQGARGVAEADP